MKALTHRLLRSIAAHAPIDKIVMHPAMERKLRLEGIAQLEAMPIVTDSAHAPRRYTLMLRDKPVYVSNRATEMSPWSARSHRDRLPHVCPQCGYRTERDDVPGNCKRCDVPFVYCGDD